MGKCHQWKQRVMRNCWGSDSLSTILEEIFAREEEKKKARETSLDAKFQDYKNLGYPPAQPLSKSVGC